MSVLVRVFTFFLDIRRASLHLRFTSGQRVPKRII